MTGSFRNTEENREKVENEVRFVFFLISGFLKLNRSVWECDNNRGLRNRRRSSSSATELGREESQSMVVAKTELESLELPEESRAAAPAAEEEEERSVRSMLMRGERWRGKSWPL